MWPIDADALEKQGWIMHRTVCVNPQTMEMQAKKPSDFPAITDAVLVVRCKDCKHRPKKPAFRNYEAFNLIFPDEICPLQCDDRWFNREPDDDWFCANGERSEDGR